MGVRARPARVDQHLFARRDLRADDLHRLFLLWEHVLKACHILRRDKGIALYGMDDIRLVVGLVGIDGQQVEIRREYLVGDLPVLPKNPRQFLFRFLVRDAHVLRHLHGYGDFLVVRQLLAHVGKRQEGRVLQQKARKHQRRYAGELPCLGLALARAAVGVVVRIFDLVGGLDHAVLRIKVIGLGVAFPVLEHQARHHAVEQMENARAVAVDERGRHADDVLRRAEQLRHRVALAARVVVLVQLVAEETVHAPAPC